MSTNSAESNPPPVAEAEPPSPPPSQALPPPLQNQVSVEYTAIRRLIDTSAQNRRKTTNYNQEEVMHLLRILEDVVPVYKTEWVQVLDVHSERFPGQDCASI